MQIDHCLFILLLQGSQVFLPEDLGTIPLATFKALLA
jgi:hypothetical protein